MYLIKGPTAFLFWYQTAYSTGGENVFPAMHVCVVVKLTLKGLGVWQSGLSMPSTIPHFGVSANL